MQVYHSEAISLKFFHELQITLIILSVFNIAFNNFLSYHNMVCAYDSGHDILSCHITVTDTDWAKQSWFLALLSKFHAKAQPVTF